MVSSCGWLVLTPTTGRFKDKHPPPGQRKRTMIHIAIYRNGESVDKATGKGLEYAVYQYKNAFGVLNIQTGNIVSSGQCLKAAKEEACFQSIDFSGMARYD